MTHEVRKEQPLIVCKDCGRSRPHKARGLCSGCYTRWRREQKRGICPLCGSNRPLSYKGPLNRNICKSCYSKREKKRPITCPECGREAIRHHAGYCAACYQRIKRSDRRNGKVVKLDHDIWRAARQMHRELRRDNQCYGFQTMINEMLEVKLMERKYLPFQTRQGKYDRGQRMASG